MLLFHFLIIIMVVKIMKALVMAHQIWRYTCITLQIQNGVVLCGQTLQVVARGDLKQLACQNMMVKVCKFVEILLELFRVGLKLSNDSSLPCAEHSP